MLFFYTILIFSFKVVWNAVCPNYTTLGRFYKHARFIFSYLQSLENGA